MCSGHFEGQENENPHDDKLENDEFKDEDGILNLKTNTIPKGWLS